MIPLLLKGTMYSYRHIGLLLLPFMNHNKDSLLCLGQWGVCIRITSSMKELSCACYSSVLWINRYAMNIFCTFLSWYVICSTWKENSLSTIRTRQSSNTSILPIPQPPLPLTYKKKLKLSHWRCLMLWISVLMVLFFSIPWLSGTLIIIVLFNDALFTCGWFSRPFLHFCGLDGLFSLI